MNITIIQAAIFLSYIALIIKNFGILSSISESWYQFSSIRRGWVFTLFCWSLGVLMTFQGDSPLFFISGFGLCMVGTATQFNLNTAGTRVIHYAGAVLGIGCSILGLMIEYKIAFPFVLFCITMIFLQISKVNNKLWWIEIAAFISIITGLFSK